MALPIFWRRYGVALLDIHAILSTLESSDSSQALQILEGTVASACKEMDALHCLLNGVALLDVLQSFAAVVGSRSLQVHVLKCAVPQNSCRVKVFAH